MKRAGSIKRFLLGLWCLACLLPGVSSANGLRVLLVLSDAQPLYQNFTNTLKLNLPTNIQVAVVERVDDFSGDSQAADLIVTVGMKAAESVGARTARPMLAAMIPRHRYADVLARRPAGAQTSAIFLDQSWARQADLIRAVMPERVKVGVLHSPATRLDLSDLRKQLEIRGATLIAKQMNSAAGLFDDLEELLSRSDVLLAVPDSEVFNSNSIRNILLTSYRHGTPLIGFSQAYVNAGALCAIFSSPEQLATQARTLAISYAQTRLLPEAQFPAQFSIAVNQEVARTLGSTIKPAEMLHSQIDKSPRAAP